MATLITGASAGLGAEYARQFAALGHDLVSRTDSAGIAVEVLVNNAGFGTHGDLIDADPQRLTDEIQLN
jgi:uncharacterized protein